MLQTNRGQVFGRRGREHTIIIASGDRIRHFTMRPWMATLGVGCVCLFAVGYLSATAYLFMRDDLLGTVARQAHLERVYEDRITSLRAQVDRATSRQLVDQQELEQRLQKLYERQIVLSSHHGRLSSLMARARSAGLVNDDIPTPQPRPASAEGSPALDAIDAATGNVHKADASLGALPVNGYLADANLRPAALDTGKAPAHPGGEQQADAVVGQIDLSLRTMENDQFEQMRTLTSRALKTAGQIRTVLDASGLPSSAYKKLADEKTASTANATPAAASGIGGPYIRITDPATFDKSLARLNKALDRLESVRQAARKLPFGQPLTDDVVTSPFGARDDPFFEKMAFHPGVDLRAAYGTDVHATGAGTVVFTGHAGGYGNMIEIDHGDGVTTRYGHLSRILVEKGEHVAYGAVIGESGSTGRSTGPHLHYEVRLNDHAVNPTRFLSAAMTLKALLGA